MPMPNWANGAVEWAKGHKAQAGAIAVGVLVVLLFMFSGGEDPGTVDQGSEEDDLFGAGALPEDVTTASALNAMQARMEALSLDMGRQRERDDQLEQSLKDQVAMLSVKMEAQERVYTEQLEAALGQAIALARQTERRADAEALADLPPPVPTLRILRPGGGPEAVAPGSVVPAPAPAAAPDTGAQGGPWVRLPLGATVTGELLTGAFATKGEGRRLAGAGSAQELLFGSERHGDPVGGLPADRQGDGGHIERAGAGRGGEHVLRAAGRHGVRASGEGLLHGRRRHAGGAGAAGSSAAAAGWPTCCRRWARRRRACTPTWRLRRSWAARTPSWGG